MDTKEEPKWGLIFVSFVFFVVCPTRVELEWHHWTNAFGSTERSRS
jgi:hypothetical protein